MKEWDVRVVKCHTEAEENDNQDKAIHCIRLYSTIMQLLGAKILNLSNVLESLGWLKNAFKNIISKI